MIFNYSQFFRNCSHRKKTTFNKDWTIFSSFNRRASSISLVRQKRMMLVDMLRRLDFTVGFVLKISISHGWLDHSPWKCQPHRHFLHWRIPNSLAQSKSRWRKMANIRPTSIFHNQPIDDRQFSSSPTGLAPRRHPIRSCYILKWASRANSSFHRRKRQQHGDNLSGRFRQFT